MPTGSLAALIDARLDGSLAAVGSLREQVDRIRALGDAVIGRLRAGGTLYTAGNGGSAAQALHLAEELIGRYRGDRPALPALCLNADPTALTCIGNDYGFERVFARQCEALLGAGDVLAVIGWNEPLSWPPAGIRSRIPASGFRMAFAQRVRCKGSTSTRSSFCGYPSTYSLVSRTSVRLICDLPTAQMPSREPHVWSVLETGFQSCAVLRGHSDWNPC